jgi:hypothetical protein
VGWAARDQASSIKVRLATRGGTRQGEVEREGVHVRRSWVRKPTSLWTLRAWAR